MSMGERECVPTSSTEKLSELGHPIEQKLMNGTHTMNGGISLPEHNVFLPPSLLWSQCPFVTILYLWTSDGRCTPIQTHIQHQREQLLHLCPCICSWFWHQLSKWLIEVLRFKEGELKKKKKALIFCHTSELMKCASAHGFEKSHKTS